MTTMEMGPPGVSALYWTWKLSSKGKQRSVRQRRTSFAGLIFKQLTTISTKMSRGTLGKGPTRVRRNRNESTAAKSSNDSVALKGTGSNRKKSSTKSSKKSRDFIVKEPKRAGGMSVSESVKLGVSIPGRRFSDTLEFVPIKKRRVNSVPFPWDDSGNETESNRGKSAAYGNTILKEMKGELHEVPDFSSISLLAAAEVLKEIKEGHHEVPDLSGMSLLAAVAHYCTITDDNMERKVSGCKGEFSEGDGISRSTESCSLSDVKEDPLFSTYGDSEKECRPISLVDGSAQEECQLEGASVMKIDLDEEADCSSPAGGTLCPERCSSLMDASILKNENVDAYPVSMGLSVEIAQCHHLFPTEKASTHGISHVSKSLPEVDQTMIAVIPAEIKDELSVADLDVHTGGRHLIIAQTQTENNSSLCTDSEIHRMDQHAMFSHPADDVLLEGNSSCQSFADADGTSNGITHIDDALDNSGRDHDDNSKLEMNSCLSDSRPFTTDGALSSLETCKSDVDSFGNSPYEVALGDHADCRFDSHASQSGIDQGVGLEKNELLSDDDSQYEDGEFRGSIINGWGENEVEDGETECVDYNRDTDGARESFPSANLKLKSLGQDQWPQGCKSSVDRIIDSGSDPDSKNQTASMYVASNAGESLRSMAATTSSKCLPSRSENPNFSDVPDRRDRYYVKTSRSGEATEPNFRFGDINRGRSFRRCRPSQLTHNQGREDHWVDSRKHQVPESRDTPGYYGLRNFTRPGSKNAVVAVTAKLESNGFVIAPDGTILKVGNARRPGRVLTQSDNASSKRTRYGPGVIRARHKEKYNAHGSDHEPLCRREENFSAQRRYLHLSRSHTRSPSRSRTRSPMWTLPRETSDRGMDRSPTIRRRNRPQYFNSDAKEERTRSRMRESLGCSHRQLGFKHVAGYAPLAKNHTSPIQPSRWSGERNDSPNRFRDCEYRRSPERRLRPRGLSQDHRFYPLGTSERFKPDKFYIPIRSGRLPSSIDVDREPRHHHSGNQRCHDDIDGIVENLQNDGEEWPRAHNPKSKISSEFHAKGSPAGFAKSADSQLTYPPRRDTKNTANFISFGIQDRDDDMALHSTLS